MKVVVRILSVAAVLACVAIGAAVCAFHGVTWGICAGTAAGALLGAAAAVWLLSDDGKG